MKEVTIVLDDDRLYEAAAAQAAVNGRSVQDIFVDALRQWLEDTELDEQEKTEVDAALADYEEHGGMEAREFFDKLREEEATL